MDTNLELGLEQQIINDMRHLETESVLSDETHIESRVVKAINNHRKDRAREQAKQRQLDAAKKKQELEEIISTPIEMFQIIVDKGIPKSEQTAEEKEALEEFRKTQEYIRAVDCLHIKQKHEKHLLAASRSADITPEQLAASGYSAKPVGLELPPAISVADLAGSLTNTAIPIPRDYLKPDMFNECSSVVFGHDGTNLLGGDVPVQIKLLLAEPKSITESDSEAGAIIQKNDIYDAIISLPISQALSIKREDIAITAENQQDIKKYLVNNDNGLAIVKPFSIQSGVVGLTKINGKDALIAFDKPTMQGQPGQLLALVAEGFTRKVKYVQYSASDLEFDLSTQTIKNDTLKIAQLEELQKHQTISLPKLEAPETNVAVVAPETAILVTDSVPEAEPVSVPAVPVAGSVPEAVPVSVPEVPVAGSVPEAGVPPTRSNFIYDAISALSTQLNDLIKRVQNLERTKN